MLWQLSTRIQKRILNFSLRFSKRERSSSQLRLSKLWKSFVRSIEVSVPPGWSKWTLTGRSLDKVQAAIESIKEAFTSDPPNLTGAKILAVQLKYWQGLEEAAKEWTPNL